MDASTVTNQAATSVPPEIVQTMLASSAIGAGIRGVVSFLKTPAAKEAWQALPIWARPAILLGLTFVGFLADNLVLGSPWYLAIGSALTGLGGAVVSYEWQEIFKKSRASKRRRIR